MSEISVTMSGSVETVPGRPDSPDVESPQIFPWSEDDLRGTAAARFERVVRAFPDLAAVQCDGRVLTYAELNRAANRIAHAILARLGQGNVPVASLLSDRVRVIQVLMAVIKAGHIHTPLVPGQPAARLSQILADAEPPLVLVDAAHLALAAQLGVPPERTLNLDALDPAFPDDDPCVPIPPESFAYIIYTSGSTGQPKGVAARHNTLLSASALADYTSRIPVGERSLLIASPAYAAAVGSILLPLLMGGFIHVFVLEEQGLESLYHFLVNQRISMFAMTASTFRHFMATLEAADQFPSVVLLALFGEPVLRKDFELFKQHFPSSARLSISLASTEGGHISSLDLSAQSVVSERVLPAGYLAGGARTIYLVDEQGARVPAGTIGEIVVSSAMLGEYWRDPERNARAFAPDPDGSGRKIFRTGDLGRLRPDGMLEHMGRKDFQVKIRGNRVELGEIEMALYELEHVREAVVVARPDAAGETQLVAYVVPERIKDDPRRSPAEGLGGGLKAEQGLRATGQILSAGALRRRLSESLPAFMLPAAFVLLAELPLTASGKIDRAQLPAPELTRSAPAGARDALEEQLAQMWADLLRLPVVGIDEDFFELGGNSLLAMQLFAEMQRTLGRTLPLSVLFEAGTIAELAALIRADAGAASGGAAPAPRPAPPVVRRGRSGETGSLVPAGAACLVAIQPRGTRRPFFLAAGGLGGDAELLIYARFARALGPDQPFYGLRARAVSVGRHANAAVEAIAAGHVAEIRAVQPRGPYQLGGECIGGMVAVEMARQLRAAGEAVALLCLLDTLRPTWRARLAGWNVSLRQSGGEAVRSLRSLRHPELRRRPRPDQGYAEAIWRYHVRGPVESLTLLINAEYHRTNPTLGWGALAPGIEVHALPGTHDSYIRQNVETTGACLRACLDRAQDLQWASSASSG